MNKDLVGSLAWGIGIVALAIAGGCGAIAAGILVTLGCCLSLRARANVT